MATDFWESANAALMERGLPDNILAERLVLGGILLDGERFGLVRDILTADDFAIEKHRKIWRRMVEMHQGGTRIDRVTLYEALNRLGEVEAVDGLSYLISLDDNMPHQADLESYAKIVQEKGIRRRMIFAAQQIINLVASGDELTSVIEQARAMFSGMAPAEANEFSTPGQIVANAGGLDDYLTGFRTRGASWPWATLTDSTGGMFPGEMSVIAADTSRGKTDFALNTALHVAQQGGAVAVFSLEMSQQQNLNRLAALAGGFNRSWLRHAIMDHCRSKVAEGFSAVADLPIFIRDSPACTVAAIEAGVRRLMAVQDIRLVVVDYLQLVAGKGQNRTQEVGGVARGIKIMLGTLKIPGLAVCQLNRDPQKAGVRPQLKDLRESGDIEQATNNVFFLYGETRYESVPSETLELELIIAKQRDGMRNFSIPLLFRGDTGRFTEAS